MEISIAEKNAVIKVAALPTVQGYKRQLQQLLQNLIGNAIKYNKPGICPEIDITASPVSENGQSYWALSVHDNGIGFEPSQSENIFKMFTRLHRDEGYAGTGVGLTIVKKVVENHKGLIKVESAPGQGSTFTVLLPS
ncbi:sensor histidine kinase [Flaviaesturariibacter amylovorans]|uniref:histidine kinase n=1 Tax=Flaviaesturariibacter amylovorans TaxID=1084520 RepID=A0ABP8H4M5_9BACT